MIVFELLAEPGSNHGATRSRVITRHRRGWLLRGLLGGGLAFIAALCGTSHAQGPAGPVSAQSRPGVANTLAPISKARTWGYQLRAIEPAEIARSPYDVVVIDFAQQGRPFTVEEVALMRAKPDGGQRHMLAYLSVGEAERYRFYWQTSWYLQPPAWVGPENEEWRGNYLVRYWDPSWQRVIFGEPGAYLDRILAAGFDGVYLDRVDAYSEWEKEQPDALGRMTALVTELSKYAKRQRPQFSIVVQNAEELLENDAYLRVIDGIAKEDLLHGIDHTDAPNPVDDVTHSVDLLRRARKAGKAVFVVEYLCRREDIAKVEQRIAKDLGFVPYVAPRTLHRLGLSAEDYCLPPGPQGRRIALVIGNGSYQFAPPIAAAATGATGMAETLRKAGFSEVRLRGDLARDAFNHELQRFAEAARGADWAVLYFAGLGLHFDGVNYVLPVNANIERAADIERDALLLETLLRAMEPATKVRLLLLDACRPNAMLDAMQKRGLSQAAGHGVTARATPRPVTIGYASRCDQPVATKPGELDAYTAALLRHIPTAGLELPWLLERTKDSVLRATGGAQEPVHLGTLPDGAVFTVPANSQAAQPAPPKAR